MAEPTLSEAPLPCIVHWNQNHFVVVFRLTRKNVFIADPADGKIKLSHQEFKKSYCSDGDKGVALLIETTPEFHKSEIDDQQNINAGFLLQYIKPHKRLLIQMMAGLLLGTLFQLIFPFLTQSLVDIGIDTSNLEFIYIILAAQLMLFFSQMTVRFIQSWIILHISVRVNVNLIADFLQKLMKLPLGFFDSKNIGDLLQRIGDHKRIESFLTQSLLTAILSIVNLIVFGIVLLIYSIPIFILFSISSVLYILWVFIFLKKRKEIDYKAFQQMSDNQSALIEIIQGMPEIKLQGSHLKRRWQWAAIQAKIFRVSIKSLTISQYQDAGAMSITQLKDIFITFIAARAVIEGQMTLGMLLAIQYIIGQLNAPLQQLIGFIRSAQDAFISLERLGEIHNKPDDEDAQVARFAEIPVGDIIIEGLSFRYNQISEDVLKDINIVIPRSKTTAIVGASGSGKTTLIKLLLRFYPPAKGKIKIGHTPLEHIYQKVWRDQCGVVMQEGFIFSDSIANNIAESDDHTDLIRVNDALHTSNIEDFVHELPLGVNTMIGAKGNGLSQGQRQRMLIARAIYKNPEFIFFDEATNALDANNEKIIMENLHRFFQGRTAVIVAHRLSTVKNADQIIVLDQGAVVETGTHHSLVAKKGYYYTLVKNQLELGQ